MSDNNLKKRVFPPKEEKKPTLWDVLKDKKKEKEVDVSESGSNIRRKTMKEQVFP